MLRAYVQDHLPTLTVAVYLIEGGEGQDRYIHRHVEDDVWQSERLTEGLIDQKPSFTLSDSQARALLDALAAHYAGASDVRQLRADYSAERARVDKLIEAVIAHREGDADA